MQSFAVSGHVPDQTVSHDLIVIGGGVAGVMTALLAAEAGRRVLLLEKDRFGAATSGAWFQILHGGLRYLQNLDLGRLRASMADRRWFMRAFPDLIRPAPFLMPLYNRGAKRPDVFRLAFVADAALTMDRNRGIDGRARIPRGRVVRPGEVEALYPGVRRDGLTGGALWTEAVAPDGDALLQALVDRARRAGVDAREGVEVKGALTAGRAIAGVEVKEALTGRILGVRAPVVVNAAGPDAGALARRLDAGGPYGDGDDKLQDGASRGGQGESAGAPPPFHPALGFNLMLDIPPPSEAGLALAPPGAAGPMLFLQPRGAQTFAGTWYAPRPGTAGAPTPTETEIDAFLQALNASAPGLGAARRHVAAISAGYLPASAPGATDLSDRDVIHDHGRAGGAQGLFTIVGVKFTTARRLAARVLSQAPPPVRPAGVAPAETRPTC